MTPQHATRFKLLAFCATLLFTGSSYGQSLTPTVIAADGGYQQGDRASLTYTIGEVSTETYFGERAILTQGFHQTNLVITSLSGWDDDIAIEVFPNPTANYLSVRTPDTGGRLSIALTDSQGRVLLAPATVAPGATQPVDLSGFPAGTYLLQATDPDRQAVRVYKIVKTR